MKMYEIADKINNNEPVMVTMPNKVCFIFTPALSKDVQVGFVHGKNGLRSNAKTREYVRANAAVIANAIGGTLDEQYWNKTDQIWIRK